MQIISNDQQLHQFRTRELSGASLYEKLQSIEGAVLFNSPPGVGKSTAADNLLEHHLSQKTLYDLAIFSAPTHRILHERKVSHVSSDSGEVVSLRGRPKEDCGGTNNKKWALYERTGTILLGKKTICRNCPRSGDCSWPNQFDRLKAACRLTLLPQQYLLLNPEVFHLIIRKTQAKSPLLILDENNFASTEFRRRIKKGQLLIFADVLERQIDSEPETGSPLTDYLEKLCLLVEASTEDMRSPDWFFPLWPPEVMEKVQRLGLEIYGDSFSFLANDLHHFSLQHPGHRQRLETGEMEYLCLPRLEGPGKLLIFSGTASRLLLEHRLGFPLEELFPDHRFRHEGSRFYNIGHNMGMAKYSTRHQKQILDLALGYIKRAMKGNRTVALVTKKGLVARTVRELNQLLTKHFLQEVEVIPASQWTPGGRKYLVPVLHYGGAIGFNSLEEIDCLMCLAGYYIRTDELNRMLNEVVPRGFHTSFYITTDGRPWRRRPAANPGSKYWSGYVQKVAEEIIQQEEMGVVIQAVSRIRPFTRPREVVTFQCGESPYMPYDREFNNLQEAREFFDIPSDRERQAALRYAVVQILKRLGQTQREIAAASHLSLRTVVSRWREDSRHRL